MPNLSWDSLVEAAGEAGKAFEPLPVDNYNFVVSEATTGESKTGKKSIGITAIIENGPYAKRKVWNTWYISPDNANALAYFFREMAIFGLDLDFWKSKPDDALIISSLVNKRFVGGVVQKEYPEGSGKIRNEIDSFAAPVGAALGNAAASAGQGGGPTGVPTVPTVAAASPMVPQVPQAAAAPAVPQATAPAVPQVPATPSVPSSNPWDNAAPAAPGL